MSVGFELFQTLFFSLPNDKEKTVVWPCETKTGIQECIMCNFSSVYVINRSDTNTHTGFQDTSGLNQGVYINKFSEGKSL